MSTAPESPLARLMQHTSKTAGLLGIAEQASGKALNFGRFEELMASRRQLSHLQQVAPSMLPKGVDGFYYPEKKLININAFLDNAGRRIARRHELWHHHLEMADPSTLGLLDRFAAGARGIPNKADSFVTGLRDLAQEAGSFAVQNTGAPLKGLADLFERLPAYADKALNAKQPLRAAAMATPLAAIGTGAAAVGKQFNSLISNLMQNKKASLKIDQPDPRPDSMYSKQEINEGVKEEKNHSPLVAVRKEIVKDHLEEDPKYYEHEEGGARGGKVASLNLPGSGVSAPRSAQGLEHRALPAIPKISALLNKIAQSVDRSSLPFRESAEALLLNGDQLVAQCITKPDGPRFIKFPGGGIDPGETTRQGLKRELMEEAGATAGKLLHHGSSQIVWPESFACMPQKYNTFQGSRRHVFSGIAKSLQAPTSQEGDAMTSREMPLPEALKITRQAIKDPSNDSEGTMLEHRKIQLQALQRLGVILRESKSATSKTASPYRTELKAKIVHQRQAVHPAPTQAQREAGNYRKGHVWIQGLDITIENPRGSVRSGTAPDGTKWRTVLKNDYGYIRNFARSAADSDHVDCFVGPHPDSEMVYVVDQNRKGTQVFDEHKSFVGWLNAKEAKQAYLDNFDDKWDGFRAITALTMKQFKAWLKRGDTSKPLAGQQLASFIKHAINEALPQDPDWGSLGFIDKATWPLWTRAGLIPAGAMGALGGAAIGATLGGLKKLKNKLVGDPSEVSIADNALMGAAGGLGLTAISHMSGRISDALPKQANEVQALEAELLSDPHMSDWRRDQILQEIRLAHTMGISMDPQQLMGSGLGALAGWIAGKALGMGVMGGIFAPVAAATGGALGYWLGTRDPNTIYGQGFYRP